VAELATAGPWVTWEEGKAIGEGGDAARLQAIGRAIALHGFTTRSGFHGDAIGRAIEERGERFWGGVKIGQIVSSPSKLG